MDSSEKLALISQYEDFEREESSPTASTSCVGSTTQEGCSASVERFLKHEEVPVQWAVLPNGKRIPLLKPVLTSVCENSCTYCGFRSGRDFRRISFTPDELANVFLALYRRGAVEGLFLSSGIAGGGMHTQDRLIAAAEILRKRYHFQGYLHLKIMPGAEYDQVLCAMQLADRVSINLEAPNENRLKRLSPDKSFSGQLISVFNWIEEIKHKLSGRQGWRSRWPSTTTQFVTGGSGESDLELLQTTEIMHKKYHLSRVYFSGFKPVKNTPLEGKQATDPLREYRLYQASFLLRDYGFDFEDIPFKDDNLSLEKDPKTSWADHHLREIPVDINRADRETLLRVPGIGPKLAEKILSSRRIHQISDRSDLKKLGVCVERALPYVLLGGKRANIQLKLFY